MNLDQDLLNKAGNPVEGSFRLWEPEETVIVLGRASKENEEVILNEANKNNIKIMKRVGGGGTVVLTKGMLVITIAKHVGNNFNNAAYFKKINELIINCLESLNIKGLSQNGISDICINDRKVLGCSMFRKLDFLFYQASLLIEADINVINKYLKHPVKEPDYRRSRNHKDFLTTFKKEGYNLSVEEVKDRMERFVNANLCSIN